ncbi:hypothetical protein ACKWTF_012091 [Chironomus riparius]
MLEGASEYKPQSRSKFSNRVSAINKQSVQLLKSVNAWDFIESIRYKPVMEMQVWDAISGESINFNHPNFSDSVACIVENDLMLEGMYRQLNDLLNVRIMNEAKIDYCLLPKDGAEKSEVTLKSGEKFTCDLLVGADGFNSTIRKAMDVNNYTVMYKQMGVVATLELDTSEYSGNTIAWQKFLSTGPVALLPLTDNLSSLVWTTTYDHARELLKMDPSEFVNALNEAFSKDYRKSSVVNNVMKFVDTVSPFKSNQMLLMPPKVLNVQDGSRAQFPLGFGHASSYACKGAVVIGDAAHRVHPMAGQGVNLGYGDVLKLTEVLSEATYNGSNLNDIQYLLKYEQERLKANLPIMLGVHALQRIYCNDFTPLVLARSLGVKFTNSVPPLKRFFMERAMA